MDPIVSVVVGEGCTSPDGSLRSVLEREGFDIVGYASSPSELERVLASVDPAAIVLDAEMGAMPVLTARQKAPHARVVVVWPKGVSPAIADAWVEPSHAQRDLAGAVRRATRSVSLDPVPAETEPVVWIPDEPAASDRQASRPSIAPTSTRAQGLRRTGLVATLVAASLVLLVAGSFALTTPNHPHTSGASRNPAPVASAATTRGAPAPERAVVNRARGCSSQTASGAGQPVGPGTKARSGRDRAHGNRSDGCGSRSTPATHANPGRHVGTSGIAHGNRPESPGRSAGKGHRGRA